MTPDYRALCAELAAAYLRTLEHINNSTWLGYEPSDDLLLQRARAALAEADGPAVPDGREPASVALQPSDGELLATLNQAVADFPPRHPEAEVMNAVEYSLALELRKARAVLDRWGRHPAPEGSASMMDYARQCNTQAVAALVALEVLADAADQFGPAGGADGKALAAEVEKARGFLARALLAKAEGPAVPDGREPASVATQPSDGDLWTMYDEMRGEPGDWAWVRDFARAVLDRWGHQPAPPAEGDVAEVAAWLRLFCSEEYESRSLDPDVAWLTRAADLLEQRHPAPVPVSELPQGWHMLSDIEPEPGAMCDWVIMSPWGCDHGSGEWRDCDGSNVHVKGFAGKRGLMVSGPRLTAWRALPLPTREATDV